MRQAKIQRRPAGGSGDINNLVKSRIEDVIKSQLDGLYQSIQSNIRGKAGQIKKLENQVKIERSDLSSINEMHFRCF